MARNYAALPFEYLEEMEALNDAEFGRLTRALLIYSMTGEPIALCGNERFYAKRVMLQEDRFKASYEDSANKKSEAGKKGAAKRWNGKNGGAILEMAGHSKNGYTETKTETKTDTIPSDDGDKGPDPVAAVITAYMDKVNPTPSQIAISELSGFVKTMGAACCLRAIDIALDEKKATWSYIRGILRAKHAQGVKSLSDWDKADAARDAAKSAKSTKNAGWEPGKPRDPIPTAAEEEKSKREMEATRRLLERMRDEE